MPESIYTVIHHLPIATTIISIFFAWQILSRYAMKRQAKHLLWWGIGVAVYGIGTLVESLTTLIGWHPILFRTWYIFGALLGGAPLAVGTIYLLIGRRYGNLAVALMLSVVSVLSVFVILSPLDLSLVDPEILNSNVLVWQEIRLVSPFINSLAAIFLIGGAFQSAAAYYRDASGRNRFIGNLLIAIGAILPGIGGMASRMGYTEWLYVGELFGLILIWIGYRYCQRQINSPQVIQMAAQLKS